MATVISLTENKIKELLSGWEGVALSQDQINSLIAQLWVSQTTVEATMEEFNNITLPDLRDEVQQSVILVSDLNDNTIPNLQQDLAQAQDAITNMATVDIPALQQGLVSEITNNIEKPKVYVQTEPPENPDVDDRFLVVGDTWFDSDDNNRHRIWNGVEWTTYNVDVSDFSLTVRKFMTTTHQIY
jgi:hypothetical protein